MGNETMAATAARVCDSCGRMIDAAGAAPTWGRHTVCPTCRQGLAWQRVARVFRNTCSWIRATWQSIRPPWLVAGGAVVLLVGAVLIGLWIVRPYAPQFMPEIGSDDTVYFSLSATGSNLYHMGHCPHFSGTMRAMSLGAAQMMKKSVPCPVCTAPAYKRVDRSGMLVSGMASVAAGLVLVPLGLVLIGRKTYAA